MSLPIVPCLNQVIIEKDSRPNEYVMSESGIILSNIEKRAVSSGVIVQTVLSGLTPWSIGQRVYFSPWAGFTLFVNMREYVQLAEHEILGTFAADAEVYVG